MIETTTKTTEYNALIPVAISVVAAAISVLIISLAVWSYQKNKQAQTAVLQTNDNDFQALPDIVY
jgi:NADH:ubiquinone oxidoreductase subunit 6 (subunit J)